MVFAFTFHAHLQVRTRKEIMITDFGKSKNAAVKSVIMSDRMVLATSDQLMLKFLHVDCGAVL